MGYFKYLSEERKTFFTAVAKCVVAVEILLVVFWIIRPFEGLLKGMLVVIPGTFIAAYPIWLLYAIIEFFHYRKLK